MLVDENQQVADLFDCYLPLVAQEFGLDVELDVVRDRVHLGQISCLVHNGALDNVCIALCIRLARKMCHMTSTYMYVYAHRCTTSEGL